MIDFLPVVCNILQQPLSYVCGCVGGVAQINNNVDLVTFWMPMTSMLRQGTVALRTGGVYCGHIHSEGELDQGCGGKGCTVQAGQAAGRGFRSAQGLTGSRGMGSLHLAAGRDPGGGPGRQDVSRCVFGVGSCLVGYVYSRGLVLF